MIKRLTGIAVGSLICAVASAQSIDDRVRELERRVQQLEREAAKTPSTADVPKPESIQPPVSPQQLEKWRSLKRGMAQSEVRTLLGEPLSEYSNEVFTRWEYPREARLQFNGRDGRLDLWREPR